MRWIWSDWALAALGALALLAVTPVGQVIVIVALITIMGIPLAILVMALPAAFFLAVSLRLAWGACHDLHKGRLRAGLAMGLSLIAMADFFVFRAWRVNAWLEGSAATLAAHDTDTLAPVRHLGTLAVLRSSRGAWDRDSQCDDLCRRLLLTGAVRQVLAVSVPRLAPKQDRVAPALPALEPSADLTGWAWRLEPKDRCEDPGPLSTSCASARFTELGRAPTPLTVSTRRSGGSAARFCRCMMARIAATSAISGSSI